MMKAIGQLAHQCASALFHRGRGGRAGRSSAMARLLGGRVARSLGFLGWGALAGAAVGILLAPASGSELRRGLSRRLLDRAERVAHRGPYALIDFSQEAGA